MKYWTGLLALPALALVAVSTQPSTAATLGPAECKTDTKKEDLTDAQVENIYNCIRDALRKHYKQSDNPVALNYTNWRNASTIPAAPPGAHSDRYLMTFVDDKGFAEYTKYKEENVEIPVGTVIAKESFDVNKEGQIVYGPLLFMTKLAKGEAPQYNDWKYGGVSGKAGKTIPSSEKFQTFCHDCHGAFDEQGSLGYPLEEYRVKN